MTFCRKTSHEVRSRTYFFLFCPFSFGRRWKQQYQQKPMNTINRHGSSTMSSVQNLSMHTRTRTVEARKYKIGSYCENVRFATTKDTAKYRKMVKAFAKSKKHHKKHHKKNLNKNRKEKNKEAVKPKKKKNAFDKPDMASFQLPSGTIEGTKMKVNWPDGQCYGITCPLNVTSSQNVVAIAPDEALPHFLSPGDVIGGNQSKPRTWSRVGEKYQAEILPRDSDSDGFLDPVRYVIISYLSSLS